MNILLIRLRLIGDVVFTTPIIRAVRQRYPSARLSYLVEASAAPVLIANPHLSDVITITHSRGWRRLRDDLQLGWQLRGQAFDLVIDLHGGPRSAWLTWASRAPRRVGYDVPGRSWMYTQVVRRPRTYRARHAVENQWDLLRAADAAFDRAPSPDRDRVEMPVDPRVAAGIPRTLADLGLPASVRPIVLHVSAGNPFRRWPEAAFATLAADLVAASTDRWVLVTAGPSDREAAHRIIAAARARAGDATERIVNAESLSLAELRAVLDHASLFVGGDSGPMHIAATSDVPIVSIYGPTLPERSAPWRPRWLASAAAEPGPLPCRPCDQRVCAPGDFRCLAQVSAPKVRDAALHLLEARAVIEKWAFWTFTASLAVVQLSLAAAQMLFGVSAILWLVLAIRDGRRPDVPSFFLPLLVYAALTLVSTAVSPSPAIGLREDKQLILFLIVPIAMRVAGDAKASRVLTAIVAVGAVSAFAGIVQGIVVGNLSYDYLIHNRPHGLLGHYMTYSGVLMLVFCAAAAQLVFAEREWVWPAVAVPAMLVSLAVTLSRNVWVGSLLAIVVLLASPAPLKSRLVRWRMLLVAVPLVLAAALAFAPVRERALSMFDPANATNQDRVSMLKSGAAMIRDHWLTGVGPNRVPAEYLAHYKRPDAVDPPDQPGSTRAHLHNVVVQIAAERGLPALATWLWFVAVAATGLWKQMQRGPSAAIAAAGLAAIVAMLAAGLFEHNFGDSEFLMLFLGLITLPYAASARTVRGRAARPTAASARPG